MADRTLAPLDEIIAVMRHTHGLDVSIYKETFLTKSLEKRREAAGCGAATAYLERLTHDRAEAEALIQSLEIHHSELFRDPLAFALLEQRILPGLVQQKDASGRRELRVWSAGCAAGQEAYSVAILLHELSDGPERPVPFRIFATDNSETQLALARGGVYAEAAIRNVRLGHLERWFSRQGQAYVAARGLRERVDFSAYDLLDERSSCPPASIFGEFDLVLCCNVLFYYRPEGRKLILEKLRRCLAPGGYLVTGEAERELLQGAGFQAVALSAAVFQRGR
jgi:chemotaxis methyl-accepting protein methylase